MLQTEWIKINPWPMKDFVVFNRYLADQVEFVNKQHGRIINVQLYSVQVKYNNTVETRYGGFIHFARSIKDTPQIGAKQDAS